MSAWKFCSSAFSHLGFLGIRKVIRRVSKKVWYYKHIFILPFTILCSHNEMVTNENLLCTPKPRFHQLSWCGCDPPTRDLKYLAAGHTTRAGRSNPHRRWYGVSPDFIRRSFTDLGRMAGRVGLATQGYKEICWHDLNRESNSGLSHGSKTVYPLCYSYVLALKFTSKIFLKIALLLIYNKSKINLARN